MLRGFEAARAEENASRMMGMCDAAQNTPHAVPIWQPTPAVSAIVLAPVGGESTWADVERLSRYGLLLSLSYFVTCTTFLLTCRWPCVCRELESLSPGTAAHLRKKGELEAALRNVSDTTL